MKRIIALVLLVVLAGCSSFKLGTVLYVPYGQQAELKISPPAVAASQPR